jgi:mannose/fructose/N-acetylgalactosamine-specific phosphotransferase system component IIC
VSSLPYALLLCLAGSLILLDKWALAEFGLSQPIVSCPLIGLVFGDFATGLFLGVALQLVWIEALPLGGDRPLDYQSAGAVGITSYLFAHRLWQLQAPQVWPDVRNRVLFACLVLAALATILGQVTDDRLKRFNSAIYRLGMKARTRSGVIAAHLLALIPAFLRGLIVVAVFLVAMIALRPFVARLPDFRSGELLIFPLSIGIAGLIKLFYRRERIPLFAAGAVLGGVLWALWR